MYVKITEATLLVYSGKANTQGFHIVKKLILSCQRMINFFSIEMFIFRCDIILSSYQNIHLGINNIVNI